MENTICLHYNIGLFMLFEELVVVYDVIHKKLLNTRTLCWQNARHRTATVIVTCSYNWALQGSMLLLNNGITDGFDQILYALLILPIRALGSSFIFLCLFQPGCSALKCFRKVAVHLRVWVAI